MTERNVDVLFRDILSACDAIATFLDGRTVTDYGEDLLLRSAVERQFEVIGEALRNALAADPRIGSKIERARQIIRFRNRLAHGYASVTDVVVWGIATGHLPRLRAQVQRLLAERGLATQE